MGRLEKAIQGLILFSTALGVLLLYEVYQLLPSEVFAFIAAGWVLFLVDSALTFVRPKASYYLGLVLAVLGLSVSLPQSAHYAFIASGDLVPASIFIAGSAALALIVILVAVQVVKDRRRK